MTIGNGIYSPNAKFGFPRAYVAGISIEVTAPDVTYNNGTVTFSNPSLPSQTFTIVLEPRFTAWSSNAYTLDFVIQQSYYQNAPDPTQNPMDFALTFFYPEFNAPYLNFQPFGLTFPDKHLFPLPPSPTGYWRPVWMT